MNMRPLICAALLVTLPLAGHAQTPPPAALSGPITLRYKYAAGETRRYKLTLDMDMTMHRASTSSAARPLPPMRQHMEMLYSQTVQSVRPDGAATLVGHITQMTATLNGHALPLPKAMTGAYAGSFTTVMSPTGKLLSMALPPSVQGKMPRGIDISKMGGMAPASLPDKPVRVGDTWRGAADLGQMFGSAVPGMPGMQINVVSSLARVEPGGIADIRQQLEGTIGSTLPAGNAGSVKMRGRITGDTLMKFNVKAGEITGKGGTTHMVASVLPVLLASAKKVGVINMDMTMKTHWEQLPATP